MRKKRKLEEAAIKAEAHSAPELSTRVIKITSRTPSKPVLVPDWNF